MQLRDYQRAAVDALFAYWQDKAGSPLIVLPTGAGKSLVLATICKELLAGYPEMRILIVTHVRELILGNYKELLTIWPFAPAGIYSAGVGRRDSHAQIVFGGVQTIYNKTEELGHFDLVAIDEAHLIPRKADTQYGKLFAGLEAINPDVKRIGLTATDYRLGEGRLTEGEGAMFDDVCFEQPIGDMIDGGYLCRPISKGMATAFDLTGVGKVGGDYNQGKLQAAVDKDDVNAAVVDEILTYGRVRRAWLLFCSGVEHAFHMRDEIRSRGITCEAISGETPTAERDRILADFKAGKIKAVSNNSVLTTGTNLPIIDLVAFCRPTLSAGLYVQMAGRGLRLYPGKENCLFLDFAGVVRKHGPIDAVVPPHMRSGSGEAPVKQCPQDRPDAKGQSGCGSLVHASARCCPDCGYDFPIDDAPKITGQAEDVPMLSRGEATWRPVTERRFDFHEGKGDKPPSVKVTYTCGMTAIREWLCPQHQGFAKNKANRWWAQHSGGRPFPDSVMAWLERQRELNVTAEIAVAPDGKYWTVKDVRAGTEKAHDNDNEPTAANDNGIGNVRWSELDDSIPF
jgi:DNA repair protein RadD